MRLRPRYASIYQWLAIQRFVTLRYEDALQLVEEARARDPLSPIIGVQHGWFLTLLRRYEDAVGGSKRRSTWTCPFFAPTPTSLGCTSARPATGSSRCRPSRRYIERASAFEPRSPNARRQSATAAQQFPGSKLEARGDYISPYWRARAWVRADEHDRALALLEESVEAREWFVILLAHEPAFDLLRDDVRFSRLLARVGLPSLIVQAPRY